MVRALWPGKISLARVALRTSPLEEQPGGQIVCARACMFQLGPWPLRSEEYLSSASAGHTPFYFLLQMEQGSRPDVREKTTTASSLVAFAQALYSNVYIID